MVQAKELTFGERKESVLYNAEALWIIEEMKDGEPFYRMLDRMASKRMTLRDAAIVLTAGLEANRRAQIGLPGAVPVPPWTLSRTGRLFDGIEGGQMAWHLTNLPELTESIKRSMPTDGTKKPEGERPLAETSSGAST